MRAWASLVVLAGCASLPSAIEAERAKTPKGQATIVEFVDFECPFCRVVHAELAPLIEKERAQLRVVLMHVPLPMHVHAGVAARAAVCAEAAGKGEAMADALFVAPPDEITSLGCADRAGALGLDVPAFLACLKDPKTKAKVDRDTATFDAIGGRGVPLVFIGDESFEGEEPPDVYARALDRAIRKAQ